MCLFHGLCCVFLLSMHKDKLFENAFKGFLGLVLLIKRGWNHVEDLLGIMDYNRLINQNLVCLY